MDRRWPQSRPEHTARLTWSIDLEGIFQEVNLVTAFVFGYSRDELLYGPAALVYPRRPDGRPEEPSPEVRTALDRCRTQGEPETFDIRIQRRDGRLVRLTPTATWSERFTRWDMVAKMPEGLPQPQFPPGPEGELAHLFFQESLDNARRAEIVRLSEKLEENNVLMRQLLEKGLTQQADAVGSVVAAILKQLLPLRQQVADDPPPPQPPSSSPPVKVNPNRSFTEWETYAGFRAHILANYHGQERTVLADEIGINPITLRRRMHAFGLEPLRDFWPPTRWPEQEPTHPRSLLFGPGTLTAASFVAWQCMLHNPAMHLLKHMFHVVNGPPGIGF